MHQLGRSTDVANNMMSVIKQLSQELFAAPIPQIILFVVLIENCGHFVWICAYQGNTHVLQIQNANWSIYGTVKADTIFYRVYWSKQNTALVIIRVHNITSIPFVASDNEKTW